MTETLFDDPRVAELLGSGLTAQMTAIFSRMEIAEDEIAKARGTAEVDEADPVWRAFALLCPPVEMPTEAVSARTAGSCSSG